MEITLKKLGASRSQATVVVPPGMVLEKEQTVVGELGKEVKIQGFRPGKAPADKLREHIQPQRIQEEVVRSLMPDMMEKLLKEHELKPIIRPRVELNALDPFTVEITLVEKPKVKVNARKAQKAIQTKLKEVSGTKEESKENKENKTQEENEGNEKKAQEDQVIMDAIAEFTEVELAPELVEDEAQDMIRSHAERLGQFGMKLEDWLQQQNKTVESFFAELKPDAEKRLKIRFGITWLIDEWKIEVSDDEMNTAIETLLKPLSAEERKQIDPLYQPGQNAYEQFKFQKMVDKVMEKLRS